MPIFQSLSFDEAFEEVFGNKFSGLGASVSVKDSEKGEVLELRDGEVCDVRVLHVSSPALHFTDRESELLVLLEEGEFISDGFLEQRLVTH